MIAGKNKQKTNLLQFTIINNILFLFLHEIICWNIDNQFFLLERIANDLKS